jgi:transcriptional regulator with XRE-family HTH domain
MTDDEKPTFGAVLDALCSQPVGRERHYTNVELAEIVRSRGGDITHTYISQLRRGDRDNPTCRTMLDLADALGVHVAYLMLGRRDREPDERHGWRPDALGHLFDAVYPPDRGPYSPEEVAHAINSDGQYGSIAASYIRELLAGASANPRLKHVLGLADHFGVEPAYFFDNALAARIDEQLETLVAMNSLGVNNVIMRASEETVSPKVRDKILLAIVKALRPSNDAADAIRQVLDDANPLGTDISPEAGDGSG